jgi:hypothetical protein
MNALIMRSILPVCLLASVAGSVFGQTARPSKKSTNTPSTASSTSNSAGSTTHFLFEAIASQIKNALKEGETTRQARLYQALSNMISIAPVVEGSKQSLLSDAEQSRLDKQASPSSQQNGTTSVVTKGSVPWLLAFAAEHGAVTQSTVGNTVSFKANPINVIASLATQDYLRSFDFGDSNPFVKIVKPLTLGVSFNASSQTGSGSQSTTSTPNSGNSFAGFSAHYDIVNRRDPRNAVYGKTWDQFRKDAEEKLAGNLNKAYQAVGNNLDSWKKSTVEALEKADPNADASASNSVESILQNQIPALTKLVSENKAVADYFKSYAQAVEDYSKARNTILTDISKQWILSVQYDFTNQNSQVPANTSTSSSIPKLSAITLVFDHPLPLKSELTLNGVVTMFNAIPTGTNTGSVRDYRLSAEWDVPVGLLPSNFGQQSVTLSGLFLSLLQQPLGQPVQVNGVNINAKGNIGLFQAKYTVSVKGTGIQIPFSFTYSNRTELVKESDVRGSIGVTFNLDSIISKATGSN